MFGSVGVAVARLLFAGRKVNLVGRSASGMDGLCCGAERGQQRRSYFKMTTTTTSGNVWRSTFPMVNKRGREERNLWWGWTSSLGKLFGVGGHRSEIASVWKCRSSVALRPVVNYIFIFPRGLSIIRSSLVLGTSTFTLWMRKMNDARDLLLKSNKSKMRRIPLPIKHNVRRQHWSRHRQIKATCNLCT